MLSDKIEKLAVHFKKFKKDKHSTIGLSKSVNKEKNLLSYLKKKKPESYDKIIKKQLKFKKIMFKIHKEEIDFGGKS